MSTEITVKDTQQIPNSLDDSTKDQSSLENSTKSVTESSGDDAFMRKATVERKYNSTLLSVCSFIIGNEFCERMAYFGFQGSLVLFLTKELDFSTAKADINMCIWSGVCYVTPLLGGWLADSYFGRYRTILGFGLIYLIGLIFVSIVSWPETGTVVGFFVALYLIALGTGGIKSNVSTFGADQFDDEDPKDRKEKESFFNYFYLAINLGAFVSWTVITYLCQNVSFGYGYLIPSIALAISLLTFWSGRHRYKRTPPQGSIVQRFVGVLIEASCRNRQSDAPSWLDRASDVHGGSHKPQEVQDVRAVLRILPYTVFLIIYWAIYAQMSTTYFNQGCQMDLHVGTFTFPVAALGLFDSVAIIILIPLVDRFLYPALERAGYKFTMLKKIGVGMIFCSLAMLTAGFVEMGRLRAYHDGHLAGPSVCYSTDVNPPLMTTTSIFWQVPQFALMGVSEVFTSITAIEFFYTQAPKSMKSVCAAINLLTSAIGTWIAAAWIPLVNSDPHSPWITTDSNHGHLDLFFFVLAGLSTLNAILLAYTARSYVYVETSSEAKDVSPPTVESALPLEQTRAEVPSKAETDIELSTKSGTESRVNNEPIQLNNV